MIASIFVLSKGADHVFFIIIKKKKGWNLKYLGRGIPWCSSVKRVPRLCSCLFFYLKKLVTHLIAIGGEVNPQRLH